jgi:threonyl-tRNA synthetase
VSQKEYASEIAERLSSSGLYADVDNGENTLQKKIRNGEIARYNFILGTLYKIIYTTVLILTTGCNVSIVVGQEELDSRSVNVRNRDDVGTKAKTEMVPLDDIVAKLVALKASKKLGNELV